jgi:hypothetical protein
MMFPPALRTERSRDLAVLQSLMSRRWIYPVCLHRGPAVARPKFEGGGNGEVVDPGVSRHSRVIRTILSSTTAVKRRLSHHNAHRSDRRRCCATEIRLTLPAKSGPASRRVRCRRFGPYLATRQYAQPRCLDQVDATRKYHDGLLRRRCRMRSTPSKPIGRSVSANAASERACLHHDP